MTDLYTAERGMVTLGPELLHVLRLLDEQVLSWAADIGALEMQFPPVLSLRDLASIDYLDNFPHLALMVSPLRIDGGVTPEPHGDAIPGDRLLDSEYALTSAACYGVYLHHRSTRLVGPRYVTTQARCFRNEDHYEGLRRLRGFTMREIVCLGDREAVLDHLAGMKEKVQAFARDLGLSLDVEPASDPFFEADSGRALMAQLFPVKEEFVHGSSLAIGSLNFHRNFFGDRCGISLDDGAPALTGCVAFGWERWLAALLETHADIDVVIDRVTDAAS